MNSNKNTSIALLALLGGLVITSGCVTQTWPVKPRPVATYPAGPRLPLSTELRMTEDYRRSEKTYSIMGSKYRFQFGEHLALNTGCWAEATFASIKNTSAASQAPAAPGTDAIVIPRVVNVDAILPGGGASKIVTTFALEVSLFDTNRSLVWVDTFKSESRGDIGVGSFKPYAHMQKRFDIMFEDIFRQAREAMLASPEIQQLVTKVQKLRTTSGDK
jgi:hypothetical protein